ncbi:MAG: cardiolipin synthase [Muribaculaceae bacterium]|nr:cardiolipin synthase [Muribaculaceae bacterium]
MGDISLIVYWILSGVYVITVLSVVAIIIGENRNPVRSLAWVTVLTVVPVVGLVLYFVFGRDISTKRVVPRKVKRKLRKLEIKHRVDDDPKSDLGVASLQLVRMGEQLSISSLHGSCDAELFVDGSEKFRRLIDDISKAEKSILIQYYIFEDKGIGTRLADLLCAKASQGVRVHLIYDPVGCYGVKKNFWKKLRASGVEVNSFATVRFPRFGTRINWRNHRKLCVIDDKIGYIGGMNIADRYATGGDMFDMWRDMHLRVTGSIVASLKVSFIVDRSFINFDNPLVDTWDVLAEDIDTTGSMRMQMATSGPTSQWCNIELMFLRAIGGAKRRVFIQTPYFLPSDGLLSALQAASLSGVDVRVMVPEKSDSRMLTMATSSYITQCLRAGIKVYRFKAGMLHSKMMLVDDEMVTIGSTNFDFRSFEHNFEANLFIYSNEFNERVAESFFADQKLCERVDAERWSRRSLLRRSQESVLRLLAPIL